MTAKRPALGRGLDALLGENKSGSPVQGHENVPPSLDSEEGVIGAIAAIPIDQIDANPFQPRTQFNDERLEELCQSIRTNGVITPITVRKTGGRYQLISGERRLRASKLAGLTEIPAYIRMANDNQSLEMALIENIQREDLNAIDVALSYQALMDAYKYNQDELGKRVGKGRSTVTNYLRLLNLPAVIQLYLKDNKIDGLITVTAFGCGPDSLMIERITRKAKRFNKPALLPVPPEIFPSLNERRRNGSLPQTPQQRFQRNTPVCNGNLVRIKGKGFLLLALHAAGESLGRQLLIPQGFAQLFLRFFVVHEAFSPVVVRSGLPSFPLSCKRRKQGGQSPDTKKGLAENPANPCIHCNQLRDLNFCPAASCPTWDNS